MRTALAPFSETAIGNAGWRRCFFFSSGRRHTRCSRYWSSDVCSSDREIHLDHRVVFVEENRSTVFIEEANLPWLGTDRERPILLMRSQVNRDQRAVLGVFDRSAVHDVQKMIVPRNGQSHRLQAHRNSGQFAPFAVPNDRYASAPSVTHVNGPIRSQSDPLGIPTYFDLGEFVLRASLEHDDQIIVRIGRVDELAVMRNRHRTGPRWSSRRFLTGAKRGGHAQ